MDTSAPDSAAAGLAPVGLPKAPNKKDMLPAAQLALATLGTAAAKAWQTSELPELLFVSKAAFTTQAATYAASVQKADAADDGMSPQAKRLRTLDKIIVKNLGYVKGYLAEDHDVDGGEAFYPEFGIVREGKNFRLPAARTARALALGKLVAGLMAHAYGPKKFGPKFWQPIATEYAELAKANGAMRGSTSAAVGQKNALEDPLRLVLRSLMNSIKANYPAADVQRGVLRAFGFQKEAY